MELHEYPRPANDTGIGIHWVAGYPSATGLTRIREYWIPEMKALGVKWVKIFSHDGALDFVELLLAEGIMPIVRLYRPSPNPGRLGVKEIVYLDALIRAGARYFEFNSLPDKESEWKGGRLPPNALELVSENTIADLETVLERGGMPAIPAVSSSGSWDLVGRISAAGRRDLLDGPVWQAVHNYPRNRPLDYPYDIGNQEGAAFTDRFYRVIAEEDWGEHAWRGRTLSDVNRLRLGRARPGATIDDDHDCWLAYLHLDALNQRHLGRSIPILSTECGYLVGEDMDARYPATTPDLHMAQTLEACRIMMGTSRRYDPAPDYYFCTAFWLLANQELGSSSSWWEGHAWYSDRWPGKMLPIARALRAEPKAVRRPQNQSRDEATISLRGTVEQANEREQIVLEREGREIGQALVDAKGQYLIDGLRPGQYVARLQIAQTFQRLTLTPDQQNVILNFDKPASNGAGNRSVVSGTVRGGAGSVVLLLRQSDGEEWVTLVHEDGSFRFVDLPAGVYSARVHAQGSHVDGIVLDGRNERSVELTASGWGYTVRRMADDPLAYTGAIRCTVEGRRHLPVYARQGAWRSEIVYTGSAAQHGLFTCEISPLDAGDYTIVVEDPHEHGEERLHLEARVHVDRKQLPVLTFVHNGDSHAETAHRSRIRVTVGGVEAGMDLSVALVDSQANRLECPLDDDHTCEFDQLAQGLYGVEVVGYEELASRTNIAVDGVNQVEVEVQLSAESADVAAPFADSRIIGRVERAAGALATLVDDVGNEFSRLVDEAGTFSFTHLPAGLYALHVEGGYLEEGLRLTGVNGIEVNFSPLTRSWHAEQSNAGAMPGFSTVRVEVAGRSGLPVHIWEEDGVSVVRRTGDAVGLGANVAEFRPLEAGVYMIEPEGLDVRTEVELSGLETVWVTFREQVEPVEPNRIRPLEQIRTSSQDEDRGLPDNRHFDGQSFGEQSLGGTSEAWLDTAEQADVQQGGSDGTEDERSHAELAGAEHDGDDQDGDDQAGVSPRTVDDDLTDEEDVSSAGDRPIEIDTVMAAPSTDAVVDAVDSGGDIFDSDIPGGDISNRDNSDRDAPELSNAYIFLGDGDLCIAKVGVLLNLVAENFAVEQRPLIGNSLDQASTAARVILVGDVDEATMATLVQRSVMIEQLDSLL